MSSNRPNPTLDTQWFEGLLSAAFTVQEHNDRLKQAQPTATEPEADNVCPHCGAPKPTVGSRCASCGLDELRPGERLQRSWASMWLMSQEQRLWPERSPEVREDRRKDLPPLDPDRRARSEPALDFVASRKSARGNGTAERRWITEGSAFPQQEVTREDLDRGEPTPEDDLDLAVQPFQLSANDDSYPSDIVGGSEETTEDSLIRRFAAWRVTLHFQRADLYLGAAVLVSAIALLWPAAEVPQRAGLGPWERALVTLGIAEAPAPVVHLQGNPAIAVWVDPHTALYYCPGEEQYGKTTDGRVSSQREAQMDRFEPAGRSACE